MYIANPIYDVVFKRLMEDKHIARFFIATMLREKVVDVVIKQQEIPYFDKEKSLSLALFRLDFIATIKTAEGEYKKVLIEIQKTRKHIDLMRFRNYLGEQYKKMDEITAENGVEIAPLPIITIYILGFTLPDINSAAVKVAREYFDLITNTVIVCKNYFIERLTHDCYVVQIPRIEHKIRNKIEELLSFFEQKDFTDDTGTIKNYGYEIDDPEIKRIADLLQYIASDPAGKKELEDEQEALRVLGFHINERKLELEEALAEKQKIIEENKKALEENKKALEEKDKALEKHKKTLEAHKKAMETRDKEFELLKKQLEELKQNSK